MKITFPKSIGFLLLLFVVFMPIALGSVSITADITNLSPAFTVTPSDGGSSSSAPTNVGSAVTFTATAKDVNTTQYYLAVCKTNAVTAGNDAAPTCASVPNTWAISGVTNSDSAASVTYTTQQSDASSDAWYAFVCDKVASGAVCYPANAAGDQGKALGVITFSGVPVDAATLTIDGITYEFDTANNGITGGRTEVDTSLSVNGSNAAAKLALVEAGTSSSMIARANYVYVYADAAGVGGNSIGMAEAGDSGNAMAESGTNLTGGSATHSSPFAVNHSPAIGTVTIGTAYGNSTPIPPGSGGPQFKVTTAIGVANNDYGKGVLIDANGKYVVAGQSIGPDGSMDFAVVRYNSDGTLDTTFDTDGKVTTAIQPSITEYAYAAAMQADGKIVVVGMASNNNFGMVRYNTNGSLDTDFGCATPGTCTGKVITNYSGPGEEAHAVAIQPSDQKIVVAGKVHNGVNYDFGVARYNTNGLLDTSFDTDGMITMTAIGTSDDQLFGIAIQGDGKIVAVGTTSISAQAVVRYNTDGSLDIDFDGDAAMPGYPGNGKVTTVIGNGSGGNNTAYAVALQSDGKIVTAGDAYGSGWDFSAARYNTDGTLDTGFGTGGKVVTSTGATNTQDRALSVAIQSDGKIVAAGQASNGSNYDFSLVRYNTTGTLDTSFNTTGKVITAIGTGVDDAYGVAIQSDGKIVAAGDAIISAQPDFALARYTSTGALDTGVGTGPAYVRVGVIDSDANTVSMYACSTNAFNGTACTATTLCSVTGVTSGTNADCTITSAAPIPTASGSYPVYIFLKDNFGFASSGSTQSYTVTNTTPNITVNPSDGGSSATTPTTPGNNVTFTITAADANGETYFLLVCKNGSAPTTGNPPECNGGSGNRWARSTATASDAQASVNYPTSSGDATSNIWYAFVCDTNTCSASNQNSGDNGSPFAVNHVPSFTTGPSDGSSSSTTPTNVGSNVTFTATATDSDANDYYLAVCKTATSAIAGNNAAPTCPGGSWAISAATANTVAITPITYTALVGDATSNDWYAFVCDKVSGGGLCSAVNQSSGDTGSPFVVNHVPTQSTPSTRAHALLDANSVGFWQFEDGTGATSFDDETVNNYNGACAGGTCPTWTQEGAIGGGYDFDGSNDYMDAGDVFATDQTEMTVSAWVNVDSFNTSGGGIGTPVVSGWNNWSIGAQKGFLLRTYHTGPSDVISWNFIVADGTNYYSASTTGIAPSAFASAYASQWLHLVGTFKAGEAIRLYINGVLVGNTTTGLPAQMTPDLSSSTWIGRGGINPGYLNGKIDEPHIYNRAFTAAEIKNHYNSATYAYKTNDLGVGARSPADTDGDAFVCSVDWRKNGTSAATLNMSFNKNVTSTTAGAVLDYSTYANNGQLGAGTAGYAPTWSNATTCGNNSGGCYDFDGVDDFIDIPNDLGYTTNLSAFAWFKSEGTPLGGYHIILGGQELELSVPTAGQLRTGVYTNARFVSNDGSGLTDGNWHYIGFTYDGSSKRSYIDGSFAGELAVTGTLTATVPTRRIGRFSTSSVYYTNGKIDEVKIYNRVLSAAQIAQEYNVAKPNYQNLNNSETAIGDLWSANTTFADIYGIESSTSTSNSTEILGFTTDASDGGSYASAPTNVGSPVTFTATANVASARQWYLAICKTNAVTPGSDAAPTCDGGSWAISSVIADNASSSTATTPATYTALIGDAESNAWYAFACDKVASVASCSPMTQGSGNNGSPFNVNHAPTFGTVAVSDNTELATDGDMETSGVAAWTNVAGTPTKTKETASPHGGTQNLKIAYGGSALNYVKSANVTVGKSYLIEGWCRGDGTYYPDLGFNGNFQHLGTVTNAWQKFSVAFTATTTAWGVGSQALGAGGYVEFDDLSLTETTLNPGVTLRFHLNSNGIGISGIDDNDADTAQDTVRVYICDSATTSMATPGTCTGGTLICSQSTPFNPNTTDFECTNATIAAIPKDHISYNFKTFVFDSHSDFAGTGTTTQSYTVADVAPTVGTYTVSDINPSAGASVPATFTVTVTDNNGGGDVASANGLIYDDNIINLDINGLCTYNQKNCYTSTGCLLGTPSGANVTVTCGGGSPAPNVLTTWFNSNPTSGGAVWKAHVNFADGTTPVTNATDSSTFSVATLSAVSVPETTIAYGPLAAGGTSATSLLSTLQNVGNVIIDVGIHGGDMISGAYNIPLAQQRWANSSIFTYNTSDHALVANEIVDGAHGAADGCANRSIPVRASSGDTAADSLIYWKLRIPPSQQALTYGGVNTFTSIVDGQCSGTD